MTVKAESGYDPRFGPGDKARSEDKREIVIEDVMVSAKDGEVYYHYYETTGGSDQTFEAKKIDRDFALEERAEDRE